MDSILAQSPLSAIALLRWQFGVANEFLEAAVEPFTTETNLRGPAAMTAMTATGASVGACYAQVVLSEDICVNGVLGVGAPLALSTWVGRTGISEMASLIDSANWRAWTQRVQLDFGQLRPYARAVYASTDAYLAGLSDDALRPLGEMPACVLNALLLTLSMRRGEIACLQAHDC